MNCFTRAPPSGPSFPWTSTLTGAFLSFDCRPSHGVGELLSERLPGIAAVLWNAGASRFIADAVILLIVSSYNMVLLKTNTTAENSTIHLNSFYGPFIHGHNLIYLAILFVLLGFVFISFVL